MAIKLDTGTRNAMLDAITASVGGSAKWAIYDGTRPANVGTAVTTQTKLAELTCNATFAPAASGGVLTLNAITQDSSADASGTATWFRIFTSGNAARIDGDVSTSGSDLNLSSTSIVATGTVSITSATFTAGNA
jgi:hypothetical protein